MSHPSLLYEATVVMRLGREHAAHDRVRREAYGRYAEAIRFNRGRGMSLARLEQLFGKDAVRYALEPVEGEK